MNPRTARGIAWSLVVVYIILATVGLTLQALTNTPYVNIGIPGQIVMIILVGVWPVTGALIVSRHPRHPVGWILCVGLTAGSIDMFAAGYAAYDTYGVSGSLPGVDLALVWLRFGGFPFGIIAFTLMILLFPDGNLPSARWRKVAWTTAGVLLIYLALQALEPGPIDPVFLSFISNPLGISASLWAYLEPLKWMAFSILVLCYAAALISLFSRLRRSQETERQQIKWLVYPVGLFWISIPFLFLGVEEANELILGIGLALGIPAIAGMPIATTFAIFKYRLYDIDIIINRTLVYGALTGTLALVYFMSVVLLQRVFTAESPISIVLSTLAIAALFAPLRRRLQNTIDKRFYRQKYDAQQTLAAFSARLRDEVELDRLSEALLAVVNETMQPSHASLWLKESKLGAPDQRMRSG